MKQMEPQDLNGKIAISSIESGYLLTENQSVTGKQYLMPLSNSS